MTPRVTFMLLKLRIFFPLLLIFISNQALAQVFTVEVIDYGGTDQIPALKRFIDNYLQDVEDKVNEKLPNDQPDRMMKAMANTNVLSGKGVGQDYASYMNVFLIGVGAGVAVDGEPTPELDSDISGIGAATGVVVGANLDRMNVSNFFGLDTKRLNIYTNFSKFGHTQNMEDRQGVESTLKVDLLNFGVHFRYDWILPTGDTNSGWGGVKTHWGYEFSDSEIFFTNNVDVTLTAIDENEGSLSGRLTGKPKYRVETQTHSIPLEISTDVRFLYFLTLYGGVGTDINYGKSNGEGMVEGDLSPLICTSGGFCGGGKIIQVQLKANVDGEAHVNPFFLRGFGGLQFNVPYFRIYGQLDKVFGTDLIGATVGLRYVY